MVKLGIMHPVTISREYIVSLYKELRDASKRKDFIVSELMNLSIELGERGYMSYKQILNLKYEELLITTLSIFNEIEQYRDFLDNLLTSGCMKKNSNFGHLLLLDVQKQNLN